MKRGNLSFIPKFSDFFSVLVFVCSFIIISCGEKEEKTKETETTTKPTAAITVDQIAATYDLVSFYDKDLGETIVIGSKDAGDLKQTRVIKADNTYSVTETESGNTYTESGSFSLNGDLIIFEIKKSSQPKNVNIKNTYTIKLDGDKLILTLKDSTDALFKEDVDDVLTYKKVK